eukprot:GHVN01001013.1.p1 GENE.GHVN01001013.1~~GHVN01001013.1.p1  ORF type:complete len:470 (-),score=66.67 GHVN01001013.1:2777-4186(-)
MDQFNAQVGELIEAGYQPRSMWTRVTPDRYSYRAAIQRRARYRYRGKPTPIQPSHTNYKISFGHVAAPSTLKQGETVLASQEMSCIKRSQCAGVSSLTKLSTHGVCGDTNVWGRYLQGRDHYRKWGGLTSLFVEDPLAYMGRLPPDPPRDRPLEVGYETQHEAAPPSPPIHIHHRLRAHESNEGHSWDSNEFQEMIKRDYEETHKDPHEGEDEGEREGELTALLRESSLGRHGGSSDDGLLNEMKNSQFPDDETPSKKDEMDFDLDNTEQNGDSDGGWTQDMGPAWRGPLSVNKMREIVDTMDEEVVESEITSDVLVRMDPLYQRYFNRSSETHWLNDQRPKHFRLVLWSHPSYIGQETAIANSLERLVGLEQPSALEAVKGVAGCANGSRTLRFYSSLGKAETIADFLAKAQPPVYAEATAGELSNAGRQDVEECYEDDEAYPDPHGIRKVYEPELSGVPLPQSWENE